MSDVKYFDTLRKGQEKFEAVCSRCGACCGAYDGDPCADLVKGQDGRFFCRDYENRLGPRKTVKGRFFNCVLIRDIIKDGALRLECSYNNLYKIS